MLATYPVSLTNWLSDYRPPSVILMNRPQSMHLRCQLVSHNLQNRFEVKKKWCKIIQVSLNQIYQVSSIRIWVVWRGLSQVIQIILKLVYNPNIVKFLNPQWGLHNKHKQDNLFHKWTCQKSNQVLSRPRLRSSRWICLNPRIKRFRASLCRIKIRWIKDHKWATVSSTNQAAYTHEKVNSTSVAPSLTTTMTETRHRSTTIRNRFEKSQDRNQITINTQRTSEICIKEKENTVIL